MFSKFSSKREISRGYVFKQGTLKRFEGSIPFFKNPFFLFKEKFEKLRLDLKRPVKAKV